MLDIKIILYFCCSICEMAKFKYISMVLVLLVVFATSCSKFPPLERLDTDNSGTPSIKAQSSGDSNSTGSTGGITDPNNDEDHDADKGGSATITDTENDEDHDKDVSRGK